MELIPEMCMLESLLSPEESDSEQSSASDCPPQSVRQAEEVLAAVNSLFAICAAFPFAATVPSQPAKPISCPSDSEAQLALALAGLKDLQSTLQALQKQAHSLVLQLHTAQAASVLLHSLLRTKQELLDSVSEELYYALADRNSTLITESQEEGPFEVLEEGKGLESVLKCEEMRRKQTVFEAFGRWKGEITLDSTHLLATATLEGAFKQGLLRKNPLLSSLSGSASVILPPPVLFNQLFAFLDQCSVQLKGNSDFSPVQFCFQGGLQRHFTSPTGVILQSLQAYYEDDSMIAGLFARILHVFDSDPLLAAPAREVVRLNADLKAVTECRAVMRDMEAGGFVAVQDALTFALGLKLGKREKLLAHLLTALKPAEMPVGDWAKYVLYHVTRGSSVQSGQIESLLSEKWSVLTTFLKQYLPASVDLQGMESVAAVCKLLVVGRGEFLAYLLQVYDLSVDELYVTVEEQAEGQCLSFPALRKVLFSLEIDDSALLDSVWQAAQAFHPLPHSDLVHKDAALLAIITSNSTEMAAKPLLPVVRRQGRPSLSIRTEESEEVRCTTSGGKGRPLFTPRGRESVRNKGRSNTIFY